MTAISVENVSKVYRVSQKEPGFIGTVKSLFISRHQEKVAVNNINFTIDPGETVGYIGVNGAGKSTTIKMLTGVLMPSSGQIRVLGRDPYKQRVANASSIGVVFGHRSQLWWDLALIESLNMISKIYQIDKIQYKRLLSKFVEILDLGNLLHVPVRNLSLGERMRAEIAATLLHEPQVVYLDEPTIGLDILVKDRIREFIKKDNKQRGTTVVLTTHDLDDIEEICQRVIVIDAGKIIYDGDINGLKDKYGKYRIITIETSSAFKDFNLPMYTELLSKDERKLTLKFNRYQTTAPKITKMLLDQGDIIDFTLTEPDLESIIKQIYR